MQKDTWRLIITSPNTGGWNMAVDEAIFESVSNITQPPTLRLYAWYPNCLSLGHAQSISEINTQYLAAMGWGLVRRPTGGRAILHADELTYSVCAPLDNEHIQGGVIESYREISGALLLALEMIGIKADSKPKNKEEKYLSKDPVCFQYPSDYEITFNGKKIIGSAQARRSNALLQHGSIPIFGDISRITSCLLFPSEKEKVIATKNLLSRAATLENIAGQNISWQEIAFALVSAFETKFDIRLIHSSLSNEEFSKSKQLIAKKYCHPDWTQRI